MVELKFLPEMFRTQSLAAPVQIAAQLLTGFGQDSSSLRLTDSSAIIEDDGA
jgi:hypothetical protein